MKYIFRAFKLHWGIRVLRLDLNTTVLHGYICLKVLGRALCALAAATSEVDSLVVGGHAGFLEGLGERRVRVAGPGDVLGGGTVLHGEHGLADHLASVRADDPGAEHLVGLLAGEDLDQALGLVVAAGSGVGREREHTLSVLDALLLQLLLRETDVGDLREGVDDARD